MDIAYLDGGYLPRDEVRISPEDRGFLFGDGVYEVIRSYGGKLFELRRHLDRLASSLRSLRIAGVDPFEVGSISESLLQRNGLANEDALVYLQVTRGAARRTHRFPSPAVKPTVYGCAWAFTPEHAPEAGVHTITMPDLRWARCDIKTTSLLPNCLANQAAQEAAAGEAIFVRDGVALEGTHTNLFAAFGGEVRTAPLTNYILPGVTRAVVLELCREVGLQSVEVPISKAGLFRADEVFVVGTTAEVTPVLDVDGIPVGAGRPGEIALRLLSLLRARAGA
jgi:D-alanine transaminase